MRLALASRLRTKTARLAWLVLGLGAVSAAACSEPPAAPPPEVEPDEAPLPSRDDLIRASDARSIGPDVERALGAPDASLRAEAYRALARQHEARWVPLLRRGLSDTEPSVRSAASLGLGALAVDAPPEAVRALAGALAVERDTATRAHLIRDLGRTGADEALAVVTLSLRSDVPEELEAACLAVAERGLLGREVDGPVRTRLGALLADEHTAVRLACAYALSRLPPSTAPADNRGVLVALGVATADADPDVRVYVYRALGRQAGVDLETLAHGALDADWRVAVSALRAAGAHVAAADGGARRYAELLRALQLAGVEGVRAHVLRTALGSAASVARATPVHDAAVALHAALANGEPTRSLGLLHCDAAALVDRSRGWPSRVERCGLEQVEPWERQVLEASILGGLDGALEQRVVRLRRLFATERPAVREAVLAAAAQIPHQDATLLVLEALAIDDAGIRASGLEALATIARRVPTAELVPPPLPGPEAVAALRSSREAAPDSELETLVTWLGTLEAVDARGLVDEVRQLAVHPSFAVRRRARALLRTWEAELAEDAEISETPHRVESIPPAEPRARVRLETAHGAIVIELRPDAAPTTVARFVENVQAGLYDGLTFHRVVPGFVVQGGDPRGDGYGGPDYWQRCEDNRLPYRRGTVGMALAGRDTGGSQFFFTHGAQPHLEGRYTAFGQAVEGLDTIDALLPGDTITSARVE